MKTLESLDPFHVSLFGVLGCCPVSELLADRIGYSQHQVFSWDGYFACENTGHGAYRTLVMPVGV